MIRKCLGDHAGAIRIRLHQRHTGIHAVVGSNQAVVILLCFIQLRIRQNTKVVLHFTLASDQPHVGCDKHAVVAAEQGAAGHTRDALIAKRMLLVKREREILLERADDALIVQCESDLARRGIHRAAALTDRADHADC